MKRQKKEKYENKTFTLTEHLEELRKRIIISLGAIVVCSIVAYFYNDKLLELLAKPVGEMIFTKPAEAFFVRLKIALCCGILLACPVVIFEIWRFVESALTREEKIYVFPAIVFSYLLFLCGAAFAFFIVIPVGIKFLLNMGTENIKPFISISSYISFVIIFILSFGFIFQLPIVVLLLTKLGIITPHWLSSNRKYIIFFIFVFAAILTPGPDVFSQFMMAIPTMLLYEISIILSKIVDKIRKE